MDDSKAMTEAAMCALLRGEPVVWPASKGSNFEAQFFDNAEFHGVAPLLLHQLRRNPSLGSQAFGCQPSGLGLEKKAAVELVRKHELVRVLDVLAESGVTVLLLKGAALAYSVYRWPALRPRSDTDLLIRDVDRVMTGRILSELGYEKPNATSGELINYQCGYALRDRFHIDHVLDVHWRINNAQMFSRALTYEELHSRSVPLPALGGHARALALTDALLLACMHRVHHIHSPYYVDDVPRFGGDRLIWLYDIHLLVNAMSPGELEEFARRAENKGMRAICRDGLLRARQCFGTQMPRELLFSLSGADRTEPSASHLRRGNARRVLTELRSLPRWRDRLTFLSEHLFPPADYMLRKYTVSNRSWLPMLYVHRGVHGAWKRLHKP